MNYENAKYIKMVVKKINEIEKKTRKPLDQPFDQICAACQPCF